jgi:hypothetical protein
VGPNNLDQSIPSMDIIFLVAKICHTASFADFSPITMDKVFSTLSLAMGWSKLSTFHLLTYLFHVNNQLIDHNQ